MASFSITVGRVTPWKMETMSTITFVGLDVLHTLNLTIFACRNHRRPSSKTALV